MKLLDKIKKKIRNSSDSADVISLSTINELFFNNQANIGGPDISEITYFTCLKTLAESIGKMPLYLMDENKNRIMDHDVMQLFNVQPNQYMTPIQFFTYLEYCRNHYGNAYAYIAMNGGKFIGIYPLDPRRIEIWANNTEEFTRRSFYYRYMDERNGNSYWFLPDEIIHVKSWITGDSGLSGKSVREILATNMAGSKASQKFLNDLYQKGLTANAVVKYVGDLSKEKQSLLLSRIEEQARENGRRIITLPIGFDIQTLDLKLTDSQFYELKKYNALQIAAAFGIKPNNLNDYSKSSYANSSAQNLSFYVDTLLYNITLYEQELNRKLLTRKEQNNGLEFKFNVKVILRGDPTQQADVLQKLVSTSIYSPNDARRQLDIPPTKGGDVHIVNGSYVALQDIGIAYRGNKGGENS